MGLVLGDPARGARAGLLDQSEQPSASEVFSAEARFQTAGFRWRLEAHPRMMVAVERGVRSSGRGRWLVLLGLGAACADRPWAAQGMTDDETNGEVDGDDAASMVDSDTDPIRQLAAGGGHSCVVYDSGTLRCWGQNQYGQLGHGHTANVGDDETAASAPDVDVGGRVLSVAAGEQHTCALLEGGAIRCWGSNRGGALGYGHTQTIGDDELPSSAGDVDLGGPAVLLAAGTLHNCAVLATGSLRCWGENSYGELGYGHTEPIGDDETPAEAGDVDVGGTVTQLVAGDTSTCALLETGNVRCWGAAYYGQTGYGSREHIGDDDGETPASAGDVPIGGLVVELAADDGSVCARLETGTMRCWGNGTSGNLGYGDWETIGDDETPQSVGDVDVGGPIRLIAAGLMHTCAVLEDDTVRCWGHSWDGRLGLGPDTPEDTDHQIPASLGAVEVGGVVTQIVANDLHTCALLDTGAVRCWGAGMTGALGYGNTATIGDDETPAQAGDVPVR